MTKAAINVSVISLSTDTLLARPLENGGPNVAPGNEEIRFLAIFVQPERESPNHNGQYRAVVVLSGPS